MRMMGRANKIAARGERPHALGCPFGPHLPLCWGSDHLAGVRQVGGQPQVKTFEVPLLMTIWKIYIDSEGEVNRERRGSLGGAAEGADRRGYC